MKSKLLIALALLALTGTADAKMRSTEEIMTLCKSNVGYLLTGCEMFLVGVADTTVAANFQKADGIRYFCMPEWADTGTIRKAFIDYVDARSKAYNYAASKIAIQAFIEAFPCEGE